MHVNISDLLWVFFIISFLQPLLSQQWQQVARLRIFQGLERARGTRVMTGPQNRATERPAN